MALMGSTGWWGFQVAGANHQFKAVRLGEAGQEAYLDGSLIPAPPGTTTFTGPAGVLLELQQRDGAWHFLADGAPAASFDSATPPPPVAAWRFTVAGEQHQVKVINIGAPGQTLYLDANPIPAPDGTTTFTGPGGALLELQSASGLWKLMVDGQAADKFNPYLEHVTNVFSRTFVVQGATHNVRAVNLGHGGQEVFLDDTPIPAPEGQVSFTGPAGVLLELKVLDGDWALAVDGKVVLPEGVLPQGVSFDRETGLYKASIRSGNRFKDLGSFKTAEDASARYLEAKAGS